MYICFCKGKLFFVPVYFEVLGIFTFLYFKKMYSYIVHSIRLFLENSLSLCASEFSRL